MPASRRWGAGAVLAAAVLIPIVDPCEAAEVPDAQVRADSDAPRGAVLTAEGVLALAVRLHPRLQAASARIEGVEARATQAGLRPNPELQVDVENVGPEFAGFDATEVTVWVSQRLELGGKRPRRRASAEGLTQVAKRNFDQLRLEIETEAAVRFVEVWIAQERLALATEEANLIRDSLARLREASTPAELARGEVALGRAALDQDRARAALDAARVRLAASWGGTEAESLRVEADLDETPEPAALADALADVGEAPAIALTRAELEQQREQLQLARSEAFPDVTLSVGYRRFTGVDRDAAVFSIGVPIPLFDRNQGERRAAQHDLVSAERAARATRLALRNAVIEAHTRLAAAHGRVGPEREELLGNAERAWRETRTAYGRGDAPFVALLDARRVLFDVRARYLDAIQAYHVARIDLERLLGTLEPWACDVTAAAPCPPSASDS